MKSKKLLWMVAAFLVVAIALPAFGYFEDLKREDVERYEDHPWGGEVQVNDDIFPSHKFVDPSTIGTPMSFFNLIRVIIDPDYEFDVEGSRTGNLSMPGSSSSGSSTGGYGDGKGK